MKARRAEPALAYSAAAILGAAGLLGTLESALDLGASFSPLAGIAAIPLALAALVPLGFVSVTFAAAVNSTLQLGASPEMRGRVMALYSVVFLGSTPIGGPVVGWLAEVAGPRSGLVLAGVVSLWASGNPDGLEFVAERLGFIDSAGQHGAASSPFADYGTAGVDDPRLSGGLAGLVGVVVVAVIAFGLMHLLRRPGSRDGD